MPDQTDKPDRRRPSIGPEMHRVGLPVRSIHDFKPGDDAVRAALGDPNKPCQPSTSSR